MNDLALKDILLWLLLIWTFVGTKFDLNGPIVKHHRPRGSL